MDSSPHFTSDHVPVQFSLNSAFFCQIDSISSIWPNQPCMELVIVRGTGQTESSVAYLGEHQTYNLRAWVQLPSNFWSVGKIFD